MSKPQDAKGKGENHVAIEDQNKNCKQETSRHLFLGLSIGDRIVVFGLVRFYLSAKPRLPSPLSRKKTLQLFGILPNMR